MQAYLCVYFLIQSTPNVLIFTFVRLQMSLSKEGKRPNGKSFELYAFVILTTLVLRLFALFWLLIIYVLYFTKNCCLLFMIN